MLKDIFRFLFLSSPVVILRFAFNIVFVRVLLERTDGLYLLKLYNSESALANSFVLFSSLSLGSYFVFRGLSNVSGNKRNRLLRIGLYSVVSKLLIVAVLMYTIFSFFSYSEISRLKLVFWLLLIVGSFVSHFYINQNNANGQYGLNNKISIINFLVLFSSLFLFFLIPSLFAVYIVLFLLGVFPLIYALFFDRQQLAEIAEEIRCGLFSKFQIHRLRNCVISGVWITATAYLPVFFYYYGRELFCNPLIFSLDDFEVTYRVFSIIVSLVSFFMMSFIIPKWHNEKFEISYILIFVGIPLLFFCASFIYFFLVGYCVKFSLSFFVMLTLMSAKIVQIFFLNWAFARNQMKNFIVLLSLDFLLIIVYYATKKI